MTTVTIQTAKAKLPELIERVSVGEEVIIADGAIPVARLVPCSGATKPARPKRKFGSMRGQFSVGPEFFEPLPDDILKAWNDPE